MAEKKRAERRKTKDEKGRKIIEKEASIKSIERKPEKYDKQTKAIIIIMAVLFASIFLVNWIFQEIKKFEYNEMDFYKEKEGSIMYYKSLLGYVSAYGEEIPFILKLRNDPRKLSKIPIEGVIRLRNEAVLSISPEIADCPDTYITLVDFSRTLKAFGTKASAATTDKDYSIEYGAALADCKDSINKTVIVMKEGSGTRIIQETAFSEDCYIMEIDDCKVQEVFERFILEFIEKSMKIK